MGEPTANLSGKNYDDFIDWSASIKTQIRLIKSNSKFNAVINNTCLK